MKKTVSISLLFLFSLLGHALEPIGEIVSIVGNFRAVDSEKKARRLPLHASVYAGDTLSTDEVAKGQIRFTDGTLLLLIPGSQIRFDTYTKDRFVSTLMRGGIRVATGFIAKKGPESFQIITANATVGALGTLFEARLYLGSFLIGSSFGDVTVQNGAGSLTIGTHFEFQFAEAPAKNVAPRTFSTRPIEIDLSVFAPPSKGGVSFDAPTSPSQCRP